MQLYQQNIPVEAEAAYRLSFAAYSSSGHGMGVLFQQHGAPCASYGLDTHLNLTTLWALYSIDFTSTTQASVRLRICVGPLVDLFWLLTSFFFRASNLLLLTSGFVLLSDSTRQAAMAQTSSSRHGWLHPTGAPFRFAVLLFVSILTFGSYFAYDSVGAIAPTLIDALGLGRESIGQMYTLYSVAAILSVFIGGMLIDRIGTRKASLLFSGLVTLGAAIVAFAPNLWVLYFGRFVFGWGSESLVVAQSAIISRWFKGKELALAFGIALTLSRLGTLFSFNTEALIAEYFNDFRMALWAAVLFCAFSLVSNLVYIILDRRGEHALGLKEESAGDQIKVADVKKFNPSFWYVTMLCVTFYSAIFPFTALSTDFFHDKWGLPLTAGTEGGFLYQVFYNILHMFTTAGGTTTIIIFASMALAPFFGRLVDRFGRRASMMILGSALMIPAFLSMGFTMIAPVFPMVVLGAAFVMVPAAMWPSIPLIVEKNRVGTAFGLCTMVQNVGLALFPWLNGLLRDMTQNYTASMLMFSMLGVAGFIFALLLKRADAREGGKLEQSSSPA